MLVSSTILKLLVLASLSFLLARGNDAFNYDKTDWKARNFGPKDWDLVECDDVATCVSSNRKLHVARPSNALVSSSHLPVCSPSLAGLRIGRNLILLFLTMALLTCVGTAPHRRLGSARSTRSRRFPCRRRTRRRVANAKIATK